MQFVPAASGEGPVIPVAVVSPSPAVRSGLRALIDGRAGIVVAAESPGPGGQYDGPIAVIVGEATPHELAAWREEARSRALVLLGDRETLLTYRSVLGAPSALLLREASAAEIAAAVASVAAGLSVFDPSLAPAQPAAFTAADGLQEASLTPRELDVLRLVASGLPNKTIALELHISDHTVKFHMGSIMSKLDASSRTEAVTRAVRQGLLPL